MANRWHALRGPAAAVLLWTAAAPAQGAVDLLQTPAAAAFKAGDYERAETELARLASENPEDVTILRYWAITLQKLERYPDSLAVFKRALTLAPTNPAVRYHLAVTLYKAGFPEAAAQSFADVLRLAPQSEYANLARQYLDAISAQLAKAQRPAEPARFGVYAQAGAQYDSNILAAPDGATGDRNGGRYNGYLSGRYYFARNADWVGTVDLSGYAAGYGESRFDALRISQWNPGVSLQRSIKLGPFPSVDAIRYDYLNVELDGEGYSKSNVVTLSSRIAFSPRTTTSFFYRYTHDAFADDGFDPRFSSRDADNHAAGVVNTWYLHDRRVEIDAGFELGTNDAEGVNFNYDTYTLRSGARFTLPAKLHLDVDLSWGRDRYPDFAGPVRRTTDRLDLDLSLKRWFGSRFLIQLNAAWRDEDSSYDALTWDRYILGLSASYAY